MSVFWKSRLLAIITATVIVGGQLIAANALSDPDKATQPHVSGGHRQAIRLLLRPPIPLIKSPQSRYALSSGPKLVLLVK